MKWTIGMPSFNNFTEVYFTVQSIRMYHNLADYEIVIIDNFGDDCLKQFCQQSGNGILKYYRYTDISGVSYAKNKIFEVAKGDYVLVIDSHILMKPGVLDFTPPGDDMIQGPLLRADNESYMCEWLPQWRSKMWGIWAPVRKELPTAPWEIWAMGAGFFACKRTSWLGFNKNFKGFGGETGYIQEKYRKAGRKVWCYPNMVWMHLFYNQGRKIPYRLDQNDRIRNYLYGFEELGLDTEPIYKEFGMNLVKTVKASMR